MTSFVQVTATIARHPTTCVLSVSRLGATERNPGATGPVERTTGAMKMELAVPQKVTLGWLFRRVPVSVWLRSLSSVVAVSQAGIAVGQTSFVFVWPVTRTD